MRIYAIKISFLMKIIILAIFLFTITAKFTEQVHILPRQQAPKFTLNAVLPDGKFGKISLESYKGNIVIYIKRQVRCFVILPL